MDVNWYSGTFSTDRTALWIKITDTSCWHLESLNLIFGWTLRTRKLRRIVCEDTCFLFPVAVFLDDWEMKAAMASGCRTVPLSYMDGGPVRQPGAIAGFILQPGTKN
jgi:hypothetical protein